MIRAMGLVLLGAVTAAGSLVTTTAKPKCDALPGGFHWRYEDVPKMPNPTGYYWRFAELPKDVKDCWNFGPCTAPKNAAATRVLTVPGAARKSE
jgi:hypothetical protein